MVTAWGVMNLLLVHLILYFLLTRVWGRGQETYGEDPFLTGTFAVAFIHGLQGDHPKYIKAMGCAKHYAVHSGPEPMRHVLTPRTARARSL